MTSLTEDQIRCARALLDVSQKKLAAAAGVATATLNNIERGINTPRDRTLEAINRVLTENGIAFQEDEEAAELIVHFRRASRPQQIQNESPLRILASDALLDVTRVLLYAFPNRGDDHRMGMVIVNSARKTLFDWVSFSLATNVQAAAFARLMLVLYKSHSEKLFFLPEVQPDTTTMGLGEALQHLETESYLPLRHVVHLCVLLGPMKTHIEPWIRDIRHPMRALMVMLDAGGIRHPGRVPHELPAKKQVTAPASGHAMDGASAEQAPKVPALDAIADGEAGSTVAGGVPALDDEAAPHATTPARPARTDAKTPLRDPSRQESATPAPQQETLSDDPYAIW